MVKIDNRKGYCSLDEDMETYRDEENELYGEGDKNEG